MNGRVLMLAAALFGSACSPSYDGLRMTVLEGESTAEVDPAGIELVHGRVVVFEVRPLSSVDKDYEASDVVELESTDGGVARVEPGVLVDTWMMLGIEPGDTELEVRINGTTEDRIPVTIVTAPEGS